MFRGPLTSSLPQLRFLLFSPRLLRSQLSLTVIARMLGQQEALPLWGEKTQVSLPQQDQEGLWWAMTPLPHNLLTPELSSERPSPHLSFLGLGG